MLDMSACRSKSPNFRCRDNAAGDQTLSVEKGEVVVSQLSHGRSRHQSHLKGFMIHQALVAIGLVDTAALGPFG